MFERQHLPLTEIKEPGTPLLGDEDEGGHETKPHNNLGEEMRPPGGSLVVVEESCFACRKLGIMSLVC